MKRRILATGILIGSAIWTITHMTYQMFHDGQVLLYEIPEIYLWEFPVLAIAFIWASVYLVRDTIRLWGNLD